MSADGRRTGAEPPNSAENGADTDPVAAAGVDPSTADPVDGAHSEPPLDPVLAALAGARGIVQGRPPGSGRRGRGRDAARRTRRENLAGRNRGGYSGPAPDLERDPQRLGGMIPGYVAERGWDRPLAQARVFAEWPALVGHDVAEHCAPQSLHEGELRIAAESTAWATQLRLLSSSLLARLVAELGPDVVTKLNISGPTGPSWRHGGRAVRGARGPRDTYG